MEWFIIGRDMHVLCNPSTDVPESLMIDDGGDSFGQEISIVNNVVVGTYDFITNPYHPDSKYITEGNYIAFKDKYHKHRLYTILTIEGDDEWEVHCEDIGLDLLNEDADAWDLTGNPKSVEETLGLVLRDTGWGIGVNEIPDYKRATKYDGITDSQLARVGMIMNAFDAECDFEIKMKGSKVVKQEINIYRSVGEDKAQQRFIDNINLISLRRSGSIEDLCTCMRCYGKEDADTGKRVTISEIAYDDGRYYSPKGHLRIYDREARDKWSRFRAYGYEGQNEFDGYINGTFEYDTDDAQELLNRGLSELKQRNEKKVSYEAKLHDLQADIGDTVQISDNKYNEKVYLSARVQSVKNHYCIKGEDTGVLANYKILESKPTSELEDMMEDLKGQMVAVKSTVVDYQAGTSGTEIPEGAWVTHPPETQPGQYLWTRTRITYTNGSTSIGYSVSRNGENGKDGKPGEDGIPGKDGQDGRTSYFHVKYSSVKNPTLPSQMTETPSKYIGTYVDLHQMDSNNPQDYTWSQFHGDPGADGIPGTNGENGKTSYLHIAYSNSEDGHVDFSTIDSEGKQYMGQYVDFEQKDSSDPNMYKWTKVQGNDGQDGVGIDSITKYYLASEKNTGITTGTQGWTTTMQSMDKMKRYLWSYERITYTDGALVNTTPIIIGIHGENGEDGDSGIIISPTAPENPKVGQLWQTESGKPIQRWDGKTWVLYYISVDNLVCETLSAITANIGSLKGQFSKKLENALVGTADAEGEIGIDNGIITGEYTGTHAYGSVTGSFKIHPDEFSAESSGAGLGSHGFSLTPAGGLKLWDGGISAELTTNSLLELLSLIDKVNKSVTEHFLTKDNYGEYLTVKNLRGGNIENISGNKTGNVVTLYVQINGITAGGADVEIFRFKDEYKRKYGPSNFAVHNAFISNHDNIAYIGQFNDSHFTMMIGGTGVISASKKAMVLFSITYLTEE